MDSVGIDAGGTWIKGARFSATGEVLHTVKLPSGASEGVDAYFASISQAVQECAAEDSVPVGFALPGVFSRDRSRLLHSPNVRDFPAQGVAIDEYLRAHHIQARRWVADNDAACAAYAEWAQGRGEGVIERSLLHVTWGTGIGTGFVSDGVLQYGWEGGHLATAAVPGALTVEDLAAVPALVERAYQAWGARTYETSLTEDSFVDRRQTPILLSKAARTNDALAQAVLEEALGYLAYAVQAMALVSFPAVVTIGGAMMDSEWLLDTLRTQVAQQAGTDIQRAAVPLEIIQRAELGNDAGRLGAALLAQQAVDIDT